MNRSLTTIIIIFFISLFVGVFLVWPKYQELKIKKEELLQKNAELTNLKGYAERLREISEEMKKYSTEIAKIDSALPSKFSLPSFLNYLLKTTSENGLILKNYGASTMPAQGKEGELKEYNLGLSVFGSYSSFKSFLSALERSSRLIEVENISFSSPEKEKPSDFNIGIKVYSY